MERRTLLAVVVTVVAFAVIGPFIALASDSSKPEQVVPAVDNASLAAKRYIDTFVSEDGSVGSPPAFTFDRQAQGLLITAAIADKARFDAIWQRTKLLSNDGIFDASAPDLLTATRAFIVASKRLGDPAYLTTAQTLANQALVHVNASDVLVDNGNVDARSLQLRTIDEIAKLPGADPRWHKIATAMRNLMPVQLTNNGQKLIANVVSPTGVALEKNYSKPAQSAVLWLKDSCHAEDADLARTIWQTLRLSQETRTANHLSLNGEIGDNLETPIAAVATSAAAALANEPVQSARLLDQADLLAKNKSVDEYAWNALGRIIVSTDWLGPC